MYKISFVFIFSIFLLISLTACSPNVDDNHGNDLAEKDSGVNDSSPVADKEGNAEEEQLLTEAEAIDILKQSWLPIELFYEGAISSNGMYIPMEGTRTVEDLSKYLQKTMAKEIADSYADFLIMEWDDGEMLVRPTEKICTVGDDPGNITVLSISDNKLIIRDFFLNDISGDYNKTSTIEKINGNWILVDVSIDYL